MAEPTRVQRDYMCREVVELVSEYLEGAMSPEQMSAFEVHLNYCDGCFAFLDQLRATTAVARVVPDEQIPDGIKDELLRAFNDWKRG